ncbi:murein L,D-transpeptidase [Microbacterium sp. SSW1-59]|uniref:L,D-transpeptidase family protein n=1 Tax=Microbacterium xanthum TaxID=3079794 RepID=UPI002AD4F7CF|nr:L,D-transpeptidase family protein [Microbacterium sp. SSW1-59]MDZ8202681.1 murein L,D-transpeptidase [Microbacterium sp. SSW1-59]
MTSHRVLTRRNAGWMALAVAAVLVVTALIVAWIAQPGESRQTAATPAPVQTATVEPVRTPTATPTPTGPAADTTVYDLSGLPEVTVFAVIPELPVDDDPLGDVVGVAARSVEERAPVFAEPGGEPVAALPRDYVYDGTVVPVIEQYDAWVRVMLVGRQAYPSSGDPAQLTGWMRTQDVELTAQDAVVEVSLGDRTVDIVRGDRRESVATDFGYGVEATPTPVGRSFVMTVRTEPSFAYTRGNPLIYLSVQSPTLDGFGGADVAITAFHYHDARSGAVSNGCLRIDAAGAEALAALPLGTPVVITG